MTISLYLDIYAPANATSASGLPVKVWLYGGTYEVGGISDPLYTGCFSSADAIVVTVNYRLGPLGYLALENTTLVGNYGTQDQLQALRWVQDNIAAFGGDPVGREAGMDNVTLLTMNQSKVLLFGQSAGATTSFALATLPEIKSLVNAVGESIEEHKPPAYCKTSTLLYLLETSCVYSLRSWAL